jgi:hypothetical protein
LLVKHIVLRDPRTDSIHMNPTCHLISINICELCDFCFGVSYRSRLDPNLVGTHT